MIKKKIMIIISVIFVVLLIPIPIKYKDGGTQTYNAVLYRVVVWYVTDLSRPNGYKIGTEVHFIPNNFKSLNEFY